MKLVRVAIFLTGITGLAMGGIMTLSSLRSNQEEAVLRANESLKSQATQFVDQFFSVFEASKNITAMSPSVPSYVNYRAIAKLNQNNLTEFETFASTDTSLPPNTPPDFAFQERVLNAVKAEISIPDLQISRYVMGTYPMSDTGNKAGIYIATPIYKVDKGITNPNNIEKINLTLIDPVKAFGGLQKVASTQDTAAYLIDKKGRVLAHSLSAFVGTDLKRIDHLKDTIDSLFMGAQTGAVSKYKSVDGTEQQVAFVRAGVSPFAFGVEEKATPRVLSSAWVSDQVDSGAARRNFGVLFIALAASLMAFSAISIFTSRQIKKQISAGINARETASPSVRAAEAKAVRPSPGIGQAAFPRSNVSVPETVSAPEHVQQAIQQKIAPSILQAEQAQAARALRGEMPLPLQGAIADSAESLVQVRNQIALEQEQIQAAMKGIGVRDYAGEFLEKIKSSYTVESVEQELVKISSEIAESPILYFRYHRRNQNLSLSSVGGDVKIQNYSNMQAYVRKDIELQVEHMADEGKVASISNYGPMSKMIISHLNVAHFEAWAITSHPEVSGQAKMVGVLVVLQAGMKSAQARPLLAKILKEAGNYLYAQSNKIRPRSAQYQVDAPNLRLEDSHLT